jgi:serine protease inhibitor ecotin
MTELAVRPAISVTHTHASQGVYNDTETTISYTSGASVVHVHVAMLPYLQYWTCPNAKTIRNWVDAALAGTGMKRDGARIETTCSLSGWRFSYYVCKDTVKACD